MARAYLTVLATTALLIGCGGGGAGPAAGGGSGGGGVVKAGPLTLEGQMSTPQGAVVSGLTTYTISGNITSATLTDQSPTVAETEIFSSSDGTDGFKICARNADGSGGVRTIVSGMAQSAAQVKTDPSGKYVYYVRNSNLQRTNIVDGTSNTILASASSYCFNVSGTKIYYRKNGTDELWSANANGSGQALVCHYSNNFEVVGAGDDVSVGLRDGLRFQGVEVSNGSLGPSFAFIGFNFLWSAFSPADRALYLGVSAGGHFYIYRSDAPQIGHSYRFRVILDSLVPLDLTYGISAGPELNLAGVEFRTGSLERMTSQGAFGYVWQPEGQLLSTYWGSNRGSWPLAGVGSSQPSGLGAVLCTELGKLTPSVVGADAVTRSSIAITSLNDTTVGNPLYRIDCDNLKTLAVANRNAYLWKTIVGSPTGLKGALVSFDSNSGDVANIITFTKKPHVTRQGRGWKVDGDIVDVFAPSKGVKRAASYCETLP